MPNSPFSLVLCALVVIGFTVPHSASAAPTGGIAVLELFTSEGCSSCPPADEAFSAVSLDAAQSSLPFYVLEWHVDYWDYLGWKDPFGMRFASERQEAYARTLPSSVYTPQAVINGSIVAESAADVRSVESIARGAFQSAPVPPTSLTLTAELAGKSLKIHSAVRGAAAGTVLLLAVVESGLSRTPTAGENAGRALKHSNVVRSVKVVTADTDLGLPTDLDLRNSTVIGLIQDERTMRIAAAAGIRLSGRIAGRIISHAEDPEGSGISGIHVQACSATRCIPATTDSRGFFIMEDVPPGTYAITIGTSTPSLTVSLTQGMSMNLLPLQPRAR